MEYKSFSYNIFLDTWVWYLQQLEGRRLSKSQEDMGYERAEKNW